MRNGLDSKTLRPVKGGPSSWCYADRECRRIRLMYWKLSYTVMQLRAESRRRHPWPATTRCPSAGSQLVSRSTVEVSRVTAKRSAIRYAFCVGIATLGIAASDAYAEAPAQVEAVGDHRPIIDGEIAPDWHKINVDQDQNPMVDDWDPWNPRILPNGKAVYFTKKERVLHVVCGQRRYEIKWDDLCASSIFLRSWISEDRCEDLGEIRDVPHSAEPTSKEIYFREKSGITQITCLTRFEVTDVQRECSASSHADASGYRWRFTKKDGDPILRRGREAKKTKTSFFSCSESDGA